MDEFTASSKELLSFIQNSPSCFHVIESARQRLDAADFSEIKEYQPWQLEAGRNYYVCRNDSSIIAFRMPRSVPASLSIVASHSDSPCFKIKENPELSKEKYYVSLNVEKYGGMLCSPWFDRPLSVAGKVMVENDKGIESRLVSIDRDLLMIPSLAIHMDRNANTGHSFQYQKELIPIFGDEGSSGKFIKLIAKAAEVSEESIIGTDLFLYNRSEPALWGCDNQYISSARLDDLMCAFSSLTAICRAETTEASIQLCCIFDNEEVGSGTKQGADSTFLSDIIDRICYCLSMDGQQKQIMLSQSFMLSADNGHAVHPNYGEKADPTNRPHMNGGILIKYNANQKYTTDSVSAGIFKKICKNGGVPTQTYVNHSDIAGGSTLGNISNAHISINTIDIGAAQLAMHSPYETAGIKDTLYLIQGMQAFYNSSIIRTDQGYEIK